MASPASSELNPRSSIPCRVTVEIAGPCPYLLSHCVTVFYLQHVFDLELEYALHKHDTLWGMVGVRRAVRHPKLSRCIILHKSQSFLEAVAVAETRVAAGQSRWSRGCKLPNAAMFPKTSPGCTKVSYLLLRYYYLELGYPQIAIALSLWTSKPATPSFRLGRVTSIREKQRCSHAHGTFDWAAMANFYFYACLIG